MTAPTRMTPDAARRLRIVLLIAAVPALGALGFALGLLGG